MYFFFITKNISNIFILDCKSTGRYDNNNEINQHETHQTSKFLV